MTVGMEAFNGRVLDRPVHPLTLPVVRENSPPDCFLILATPRVVGLRQAVLNAIGLADHVEAHGPGVDRVLVPGLLCELNSAVSKGGADPTG